MHALFLAALLLLSTAARAAAVDAAVREMDKNMNDPNFDHTRYDDLTDKSCFVGLLIEKAKSNIEGDDSLNDSGSQFRA